MQQTCRQCTATFEVTDDDLAFLEQVSPVFKEKKELIPPPTHCPDCRQIRRYLMRNERKLYQRKSSKTGKDIVSIYSPDKDIPVYEREEWLKVDGADFGKEVDFNRPFFDQFTELYRQVPKASVIQSGEMVNSDFTHFCGWVKNGYLLFDCGKTEDCMYGALMVYSKNSMDNYHTVRCELCYDSLELTDSYNVFSSHSCKNCSFSAFLEDCIGCKNCFGCINLRNKEYCIFNEQKTKEEFEGYWNEVFSGSHSSLMRAKDDVEQFFLTQPHRNLHNIDSAGSTGDYLVNCEQVTDSYECLGCKDCRYCQNIQPQTQSCYDVSTFGESMEFCYELSASGGALGKTTVSNCLFSLYLYYGGNNVMYSISCHEQCKDIFGCTDLRGKQYCIFNKQYTKEEYELLVPKIIDHMRTTGEWGEFFPSSVSLVGYNESVAQEIFPLSKEEALHRGFHWSDYEIPAPNALKAIQATDLPDSIDDIPDDILNWAVVCEVTKRPFKIIKQELDFYRAHRLPLPRRSYDARHQDRMRKKNPRHLWDRECAGCQKAIMTTYALDRPEIVYCEECYLQTVY